MKDYYKWFDFGTRSICAKLMNNSDDNEHWYVVDLFDTKYDAVINLGGTSTRAEMDKLYNSLVRKYKRYVN